ncbi:MAG: hypothetical protein EHM48_05325 [Planctomycetaceae bacterium]|nr:MAG: hypothetical protein EHM48_05325 [Planctomycetaceae bacterium]
MIATLPLILAEDISPTVQTGASVLMFMAVAAAVFVGTNPLLALILRQERLNDQLLRGALLLEIKPRTVTILTSVAMLMLGLIGYVFLDNIAGFLLGGAIGVFVPGMVLKLMRIRRLKKLEDQLVGGVTTLVSGVRAGLNLVQAMELVARDGPVPLSQEFAHLLREYEYGIPLDEAMSNCADRIGSGDFRLLFSALQTHRERGGDLGETLDRIAESIREIQRLEKRVESLTAQGRATARWLGAMPIVIGTIYYFIDSPAVLALFQQGLGNLILAAIVVLNILGFLWIKKVVAIDV